MLKDVKHPEVDMSLREAEQRSAVSLDFHFPNTLGYQEREGVMARALLEFESHWRKVELPGAPRCIKVDEVEVDGETLVSVVFDRGGVSTIDINSGSLDLNVGAGESPFLGTSPNNQD